MTETEWLTSRDPQRMLNWLTGDAVQTGHMGHLTRGQGNRKLELLVLTGCAKCQELCQDMSPGEAARYVIVADCATPSEHAALLRDIFGNPFRSSSLPSLLRRSRGPWRTGRRLHQMGRKRWEEFCPWLTWNDGCVSKLAQAIYEERALEGMPILADALEEAGCDNQDILNHCRGDGTHVRGCWVIDLLLGKS